MQTNQKIAPCLWFDNQAEAATAFYTSVFKNSKIVKIARYTEAGHEIHQRPAGSVLTAVGSRISPACRGKWCRLR